MFTKCYEFQRLPKYALKSKGKVPDVSRVLPFLSGLKATETLNNRGRKSTHENQCLSIRQFGIAHNRACLHPQNFAEQLFSISF